MLLPQIKFLLNNGESDVISTFGFVYAIPALVGGLALKYAELPPVPLKTSPTAEAARASKATTIQSKILSDATRFTYGDAHMEDPVRRPSSLRVRAACSYFVTLMHLVRGLASLSLLADSPRCRRRVDSSKPSSSRRVAWALPS